MNMNRKGFTLVELLAVIVILTILVLLAIPAVTRQVEYSRKKTFLEDANTAIEAARNDLFMSNKDLTEKKEFVYAFNDLNNLLEKKLVDSPFGGKYLDASVKVEMNKNSFGELDPVYYLCLIDESHNGFTYTEYGKMDIDTIVMGGIQDCNSEITTYVITADSNGGIIPQTTGWKPVGSLINMGDVTENEGATTTGQYPPFGQYWWCCQNTKPSITSNQYFIDGTYDTSANYPNSSTIGKYCINTNEAYSSSNDLTGNSCTRSLGTVYNFEQTLTGQNLIVRAYQYKIYSLSSSSGTSSYGTRTATKSISYGSPYGTLPTPVLEGSTFDGWYASFKTYKFTVALSGNTITVTVKDSNNNPIPNVTIEDIEWDVVGGTTNSNGVFTLTDNSAYEWFYEGRHLRITIDGSNYDIKDEATMGETEVVSTFQLYSSKVEANTIMNQKANHRIYAKWK